MSSFWFWFIRPIAEFLGLLFLLSAYVGGFVTLIWVSGKINERAAKRRLEKNIK